MKTILNRKELARKIRTNVRWYNQQAKQHNQGALSPTWVKYVAKLQPSQWEHLKQGSPAISLHTYHKTLNLIQTMEETVLGKTDHQIKPIKNEPKAKPAHPSGSMSKAKRNMQKVLAGIKQKKRQHPQAHSNPAMKHAKANLMKVLGSKPTHRQRPKHVVTMIKAQKQKNRFNVYVNGRYAFPAGINELSKYHLRVGMPISKHLKQVISESADVSKMFTRASTRIIHHLRTEQEIRKWLHKKYDCSPEDTDRVIKQLKNYHLIDDAHYSREYVRAEIISGSKGPLAIGRHLRSKGVSAFVIQDALAAAYPRDKQLAVAEHQAKDKFRIKANDPFNKRLRKIKLALVRKGFSFDLATDAINACHFQPDPSRQQQLLEKYTRQAFRRYGRKMTSNNRYKINMKIKRFLFRKGFNFDAIDQAIENHESD